MASCPRRSLRRLTTQLLCASLVLTAIGPAHSQTPEGSLDPALLRLLDVQISTFIDGAEPVAPPDARLITSEGESFFEPIAVEPERCYSFTAVGAPELVGVLVAAGSAYYVLLKQAKLWELRLRPDPEYLQIIGEDDTESRGDQS